MRGCCVQAGTEQDVTSHWVFYLRDGNDFSDALSSHHPFLPPGLGDEPDDGGTGVVLGGRAGLDCEGDVLGEDEGLGLPLLLDEDETEGEYCALGVQVAVGGQ